MVFPVICFKYRGGSTEKVSSKVQASWVALQPESLDLSRDLLSVKHASPWARDFWPDEDRRELDAPAASSIHSVNQELASLRVMTVCESVSIVTVPRRVLENSGNMATLTTSTTPTADRIGNNVCNTISRDTDVAVPVRIMVETIRWKSTKTKRRGLDERKKPWKMVAPVKKTALMAYAVGGSTG
jgi:hypothetical protein